MSHCRLPNVVLPWILMTMVLGGCRPVSSQRLVGRWEGRPDSAATYAARQAFADSKPASHRDNTRSSAEVVIEPRGKSPPATVLEQHDIQITVDFQRDGTATMWHNDGKDRLNGTWNVLESQGRRVRLQLSVVRDEDGNASTEVRNFELELDTEGKGFALSEEGADPHFGVLYFERVVSGE